MYRHLSRGSVRVPVLTIVGLFALLTFALFIPAIPHVQAQLPKSFVSTTSVPTASEYSCVLYSGYVTCANTSGAVYYAAESDGVISSWTESSSTIGPSYGSPACVTPSTGTGVGLIVCIVEHESSTNNCYYATLTDGNPGTFTLCSSQYPSSADADMSCAVSGADIYCVGGTNGAGAGTGDSELTYAAAITSSGPGSWTAGANYFENIAQCGLVVFGGDLFCIGGANDASGFLSQVGYAPVTGTSVGTWTQSSKSLPAASGGSDCIDWTPATEIICVGGTANTAGQTVYSTTTPTTGSWTLDSTDTYSVTTTYTSGNGGQWCVTDGSSLIICVGGRVSSGVTAAVGYLYKNPDIVLSIKAQLSTSQIFSATISVSGCSTNSTSFTGNGKYAHFSVTPSCSSLTLTMPTAGATRYFFSKGLNTSESFTTPSVSTSYSFNYEAQFRITNDQQTTITYTGNSTQATSAASSIYVDAGTNFTTLSYYAVSWEATSPAYLTYISGSSFPFPVLTNTTITGITLSSGNELVTFNASHLYARTYTGTNVLGILQNGAATAYSEGPSGIFYFSGVGPSWAIELGSSGSSGPSGGQGGQGGTGGSTSSSSSSSSAASSNSSSAPGGQTGGNNPGQVFSNLPNPLQPLGLPPAAFYIPVLILLLFLLVVYAYTKKANAERELDHLNAGLRRSMSPGPYGRQARKQGRTSWFSTRPKRRRRRV